MRKLVILIRNIIAIPWKILHHISPFTILQRDIIKKHSSISSGVKLYRSELDSYSYIGNNSFVIDTKIGRFTSISSDCYIGGATHPINWVSTSPVFHKWENNMRVNFAKHEFEIFKETNIGNDVWIGNRVIIKAGVKIEDGAIIGMGSVVTKNVGPYEIWAGNPAKFIRKRFDDDVVEKLLESEWWNWSEEEIKSKSNSFNNINEYIKRLEK